MACFWSVEDGNTLYCGRMRMLHHFLLLIGLLMIRAPATADESVGFIVSPGQQEAVEQLLTLLRQWLPAGLHLTLAADSVSSCQQQAETLFSAGITRIVDGCCEKLEVPNNMTHMVRAEYLCMARATSSVHDSVYAAMLHYLRAQIVNRVVVIGKMAPALTDVVTYKQFEHFRFVEEDSVVRVAELIKSFNHKLAVFANEFPTIINAIHKTDRPENIIWFVPNLDMIYASSVFRRLGNQNLTVVTTKVDCQNDEERISKYQGGYVAEKMVEHLYQLLNGLPAVDKNECTVTLFRWLPRQTGIKHESVHAMRSSDWIIEGSLTGGPEASLKLQPFHAITRDRMEQMLNHCSQWFLRIESSEHEDAISAEYSRETMPKFVSVHGSGLWRFHCGCVGTEGKTYVCTLNGQEECHLEREEDDALFHPNGTIPSSITYSWEGDLSRLNRREKRDMHHDSNYYELTSDQDSHYMQLHVDDTHIPHTGHHYHSQSTPYMSHGVQPFYNRRKARPRPGVNTKLLSAITPATFGCGGAITGCALCFVIISSLGSVINPLGCIIPCTVGGASSCAGLAGAIYKETAIDARKRRILSRRSMKMARHNRNTL